MMRFSSVLASSLWLLSTASFAVKPPQVIASLDDASWEFKKIELLYCELETEKAHTKGCDYLLRITPRQNPQAPMPVVVETVSIGPILGGLLNSYRAPLTYYTQSANEDIETQKLQVACRMLPPPYKPLLRVRRLQRAELAVIESVSLEPVLSDLGCYRNELLRPINEHAFESAKQLMTLLQQSAEVAVKVRASESAVDASSSR